MLHGAAAEVAEGEIFVAGGVRRIGFGIARLGTGIRAEEAVHAIAAPVHPAVGGHAAERLGRHRALHGMEGLGRVRELEDRYLEIHGWITGCQAGLDQSSA